MKNGWWEKHTHQYHCFQYISSSKSSILWLGNVSKQTIIIHAMFHLNIFDWSFCLEFYFHIRISQIS